LFWSILETNKIYKMKKYLVALTVFTLMAFAVNAQSTDNSAKNFPTDQTGKVHSKHAYHMHKRHHNFEAIQQLNLSDEQKQQVKTMNEDYRNKIKNLEKDDNITLKDYRSQKANLEKERKSKFQDILTTEQKDQISQAKKDRSERMKMISQKRMDKMKTDLNLTDDQVAKIQDERKSMIDHAKAIKENSSLSDEQKKEQFMNLRKTSRDNINKILTADQLKKRDELRSSRMKNMKNSWGSKAS
jgi:Spy/CpxP family protein refolding chaperone